jgi:hypothetical protein
MRMNTRTRETTRTGIVIIGLLASAFCYAGAPVHSAVHAQANSIHVMRPALQEGTNRAEPALQEGMNRLNPSLQEGGNRASDGKAFLPMPTRNKLLESLSSGRVISSSNSPALQEGANEVKPALQEGANEVKPALQEGANEVKPALQEGANEVKPALQEGAN